MVPDAANVASQSTTVRREPCRTETRLQSDATRFVASPRDTSLLPPHAKPRRYVGGPLRGFSPGPNQRSLLRFLAADLPEATFREGKGGGRYSALTMPGACPHRAPGIVAFVVLTCSLGDRHAGSEQCDGP